MELKAFCLLTRWRVLSARFTADIVSVSWCAIKLSNLFRNYNFGERDVATFSSSGFLTASKTVVLVLNKV